MLSRYPLFTLWSLGAGAAAAVMWWAPGQETIPYHIAWIALALAYDREVWPWRLAAAALIGYGSVTGAILIGRASEEVMGWQETAEIPLMALLLFVVMWNIRRRHQGAALLAEISERDRRRAALRVRLSRLTSHEMRTPATIALGFTDLLLARETDEQSRHDVEVVRSELNRLVRASDRLVRMMRMPEQDGRRVVPLAELVADTAERWRVVADRIWVAEADQIAFECSPDRVRACLDTLIENAVRYTCVGGTVRVIGRRIGGLVLIGVADSGSGLDPGMAQAVNGAASDADPYAFDDRSAADPLAKTGLGLHLVREAAGARGGRLVAGTSAEGGALLLMVVPLTPRPGQAPAVRAESTPRPVPAAGAR